MHYLIFKITVCFTWQVSFLMTIERANFVSVKYLTQSLIPLSRAQDPRLRYDSNRRSLYRRFFF